MAPASGPPGRRLVIVGGGPAGLLAAAALAPCFDSVAVYERREEPTADAAMRSQHSYPMVLAHRATEAFAAAGLSPACCSPEHSVPCDGHYSKGVLWGRAGDLGPAMRTWVVDRVGLAADLAAEVGRAQPDKVRMHFNAQLSRLNLAARRAEFVVDGKTAVEEGYELLLGADGASSAVREAMEAAGMLRTQLMYDSPVLYRTFYGLSRAAREEAGERELVPGICTHRPRQHLYWYDNKKGPLITFWMDESGRLDGLVSKNVNWDRAALLQSIRATHPAIPEHLAAGVVAQVADPPEGPGAAGAPVGSRFGRILRCSAFTGPHVALVGDAAHPVTGHLGQGCNMALESVRVLASALQQCGGDVDAGLRLYDSQRREDAWAMQHLEMAMAAFVRAPSARPSAASFSLPFRLYASALLTSTMLVGLALHKLAPSKFPTPIYLFAAFRDARVSYSAARRNCWAMMAGASALTAAGLAGVAAWALRRWVPR